MIDKNSYLRIPALNLSGKIESMTDAAFEAYVRNVNSFIDQFPSLASKTTAALDARDYGNVKKNLTDISLTLINLNAEDLASECRRISGKLGGIVDHDAVEAALENFIQNVSTLSIDVQMAMRGSSAGSPVTPPAQQRAPVMPKEVYQEPRPTMPVMARPGSRPLILAVDNAIMFLNTLKRLLQDAPYDVQCVSSGEQALQFLRDKPCPDLFLLDIEMPGMDGYELARRIKSSGIRAPIIFITANSERKYVEKAIEVGAVGLVVKPLRAAQLVAKIKEHIS